MILYPLHHEVGAYQHFDSFEKSCALKVEAFYDLVGEVTNNITAVHRWQPSLNEVAANLGKQSHTPGKKIINDTSCFNTTAYSYIRKAK